MGIQELNALLALRRSTKSMAEAPVRANELEDVLGAVFRASPGRGRAYGSAHARYPVTATLIAGNVSGLTRGSYRVAPGGNLHDVVPGEYRDMVARATIDGSWIAASPALLVLSAEVVAENAEFNSQSEGRGERFIAIEVGLIAQTVSLAAAALDLGTVLIAGIRDDAARRLPESVVPRDEELIAVMPFGRAPARTMNTSPES
ncbi:MAG: SagB/ThcOx family dehydrogenase [Candidatus Microbacterium stercoravium]